MNILPIDENAFSRLSGPDTVANSRGFNQTQGDVETSKMDRANMIHLSLPPVLHDSGEMTGGSANSMAIPEGRFDVAEGQLSPYVFPNGQPIPANLIVRNSTAYQSLIQSNFHQSFQTAGQIQQISMIQAQIQSKAQ
mmetsp:Transcript_16644/g.25656  ORF Transcript_16644/g.25656 Transcript_16644/m.25656 type:complete len:137 (-) Transcript_16644:1035-1445(-)